MNLVLLHEKKSEKEGCNENESNGRKKERKKGRKAFIGGLLGRRVGDGLAP